MRVTYIKRPLSKENGFTFIELMLIIALIGILASIAIFNYMPIRSKALDSTAMSDARNLVESVIHATINHQDVDYTKLNTGGAVGDVDTSGNPRPPVYTLSPGVVAVIAGGSNMAPNGNTTLFSAIVYHTAGTTDPTTASGRKQFSCSVDENTGTSTAPQ